ncbi:MAG TPA: autotransporter-associated beta strand repeat-containing protein, partial [Verrucomicrobiae bacterium]|nr:autotransporter-associated beta strand repeat-containing protein [Verrucomicrobiae bacterium]
MANASIFERTNNTVNLNLADAWTNGAVPGAADVAQWDSTVSAANTTNALGANLSWGGIKIINPGATVNIQSGNTLTNGAVGIDMTSATVNLILSNTIFIAPGALQQWNVAGGRTLAVSALPTKPGQPANNTGVLQVGTTGTVKMGSAGSPSGVVQDNQNNPWLTYGQNDWGVLDSSGTVVAANYFSVDGTNTFLNSSPIVTNMDVVGNQPGGGSSAADMLSLRFNNPSPVTLNIANSGTARTMTARGILVTANSGGGTIGGQAATSFIRPNRVTIANTSFNVIQNSSADFTIGANIANGSSSAPTHLVKSGPGNLILTHTGNGYSGGTDINGGTLTAGAGASLGGGTVVINATGRLILNSSNTTFVAGITVNDGATNSIKINTAEAQQFTRIATFNGGTNHCEFNYAGGIAPSVITAPLLVSNLTANGTVIVDIFNTVLRTNVYPLIKYTNSLSGSGFSAFTIGYMPPHILGYLSNDTAGSTIDLVVTNVNEPIKWAVGNSAWDINTTANWLDTLNNSTVYQQLNTPYSFIGDSVLFNDDASGSSPITVSVNMMVSPASTTVSNNSKAYTISGTGSISGVGALTKAGSGTLTLATANSFAGGLNLNGGVVNFSTLTNLGSGDISFNGGTLQYNGNSDDISVRTVTINSGGATIDTAGQNVNFTNAIGNGSVGGLTKIGSGTLTLNGTNRYAGNTFVSAGTLALGSTNTFITNSPVIIVNGTLDSTPTGAGLTLSAAVSQTLAGTGTVNGSVTNPASTTISPATNGTIGTINVGPLTVNGGNLYLDVATTSSHDLVNVSGDLSIIGGIITINTNAGPLVNGTYKLIQYSGTLLSGAGSSGNLIVNFLQPNKSATLKDSTAGEIDLVIADSANDSITWSGAGSAWDLSGALNWLNGATPWIYTNGDTVRFDDTASGNSTVNLNTTVNPLFVTVSNNSIATYTFADGTGTGGGKIAGTATVVKDGPGTLIMNTANTYSGTTTVKSGVLQIGNNGIGDLGTGNVTNNGTLIFNQGDGQAHVVAGAVSGSGSLTKQGGSATTVSLAGNNTYTGPTTISAGALQLGNGGASGSVVTPVITNNATLALNRTGVYSFTNGVTGSGQLIKNGLATASLNAVLSYQGNTYISNGVMKLTANDQIPDANSVSGSTGWLILDGGVSSAGALDMAGFNETINALSGLTNLFLGMITNSGTSTTATNTLTILGTAATTFGGTIADNSSGSKTAVLLLGTNSLTISRSTTYSGGTVLGEGAYLVANGGASVIGNNGNITMSNGATFFLQQSGGGAFPNNNIIIPDGATAILNSSALGNGYGGNISGGPNSTNLIAGPISFGV